MADPRNVAHDKKVISESSITAKTFPPVPSTPASPAKSPSTKSPHGAHKETDAEKAGGSVAEPTI